MGNAIVPDWKAHRYHDSNSRREGRVLALGFDKIQLRNGRFVAHGSPFLRRLFGVGVWADPERHLQLNRFAPGCVHFFDLIAELPFAAR